MNDRVPYAVIKNNFLSKGSTTLVHNQVSSCIRRDGGSHPKFSVHGHQVINSSPISI
jgi:hypothetical protein